MPLAQGLDLTALPVKFIKTIIVTASMTYVISALLILFVERKNAIKTLRKSVENMTIFCGVDQISLASKLNWSLKTREHKAQGKERDEGQQSRHRNGRIRDILDKLRAQTRPRRASSVSGERAVIGTRGETQ
jgi:hypothetical protein